MLRALVVVLLLANLAFFAWMHGWLNAVVGADPAGDREPQRLNAQIQPNTIRVLGAPAGTAPVPAGPPATSATVPTTAPAALPEVPPAVTSASPAAAAGTLSGAVCLEAGPFASADVPRLEALLRDALPTGTWTLAPRDRPSQWIAYVGKFNDREALRARSDELRDLNVRFEELRGMPDLEPGISLGRFDREGDARDELRRLGQRGVRDARVVPAAPAANATYRLRIEQADGLLMAMTLRLKDKLLGKSLGLCQTDAAKG
jgi:hypothetical protein